MSNSVPEGWTYTELGEFVAESSAGEWGSEAAGDDNDIPVIRSTNFTNSGIIDYSKLAYRNIDEKKRLKKSLKQGDMVLEKSGGSPSQPVGRVVYFDKEQPFLYSNFTQRLSPVAECDSKFLFYKFYAEYQNGTVLKFQQQTTGIINFQLAEYLGYKSVFPPLPEQQKIAAILSSVDDVIEKTRAQIDKLKDLKTGMMQELLTKGIGHTAFKDSPVGRIPERWEVVQIQEIAKVIRGASPRPQGDPRYYGGTVPRLMVKDVTRDGKYVRPKIDFLTEAGAKLSRPVPAGTLTIVCSGVVGVPSFLAVDACIHDGFLGLVGIEDICDAEFLYYQLVPMQSIFDSSATHGGIFTNLTTQILKEFEIVLPPLKEQLEIAKSLSALDDTLNGVIGKLRAYEDLKKGLMQDLLTGKVRVNVDNKENAVA